MKLSEVIAFRVSPELKLALEAEASRLKVRPVDFIRMAIAMAVSHSDPNQIDDRQKHQDLKMIQS